MSTYDVDLERTDEKPKARYLTRKDVIRVVMGLGILVILLYPVYLVLMQNAQWHMCGTNFQRMFDAVGLYSAENNDRLPPVYVTSDTDAPMLENGAPYTWVSLIDGYVKDMSAFTCPAADLNKGEGVRVHTSTGGTVYLTYGMVAPLGGEPVNQIENPETTVLLTETANFGAMGTYDPFPFKDAKGQPVPFDGFVVGYNDSNLLPTDKTMDMTRLALYGTQDGAFKEKGPSRHRDGIHALTLDGRLRVVKSNQAFYQDSDKNQNPLWHLPKARRFR